MQESVNTFVYFTNGHWVAATVKFIAECPGYGTVVLPSGIVILVKYVDCRWLEYSIEGAAV